MKKITLATHQDLNTFVLHLEGTIVKLMRGKSLAPLDVVSALSCYDVSLLIAYQLKTKALGVEEIMRWEGRAKSLTTADGHALLGIKLAEDYYYIDGTIWQVNPSEEHMRVKGPYPTKEALKQALMDDYNGQWQEYEIPLSHLTRKSIEGAEFLIRSKAERNLSSKKES